jgi:hypothetical protein
MASPITANPDDGIEGAVYHGCETGAVGLGVHKPAEPNTFLDPVEGAPNEADASMEMQEA